jgi:DNA-directed RNA polymerase subunit RPC12/RpoP
MCFRPPTVELDDDPKCPECGADIFVGATKCSQCGASIAQGLKAAASAPPKGAPGANDQTSFGGAKTAAPPRPAPPQAPKPPSAPGI